MKFGDFVSILSESQSVDNQLKKNHVFFNPSLHLKDELMSNLADQEISLYEKKKNYRLHTLQRSFSTNIYNKVIQNIINF